MNEVFKLFGSIGIHTDEAEDGLERVSDKGEKTASGLPAIFGKAALAIGGIFAAGKIIDFGKQTVEAAADADAMRSQFTQVFGDMTGQGDMMAHKLAGQFGMIPEQLKPGMIKFQGMFKGVGMSAEDSMKATEQATVAAADAAAFANVSYEDAQGSLQSFILGNYDAGDAIGIQANDNAIAQYAIQQGAVKTTAEWSKMGDAQKEQMRLGYVGYVQELSGVTGQAGRESGSFAVQMDKMKALWEKFLAAIGSPILGAVLPVLTAVAGAFGTFASWVQRTVPTLNDSQGAATNFGNSIKAYVMPIIETMLPIFKRVFDGVKEVVVRIMNEVNAFIRPIILQIKNFWAENGEQIMQAVKNLMAIIMDIVKTVMPYVQNGIKIAWTAIKGIITAAIQVIEGVIKVFSGVFTGDWSKVWEGIQQIFKGIWDGMKAYIKGVLDSIKNLFSGWVAYVGSIFRNMGNVVKNLVTDAFSGVMRSIREKMDGAKNIVDGAVKWIQRLFNFQIRFPHIPMPHFSVSGSMNPLKWIDEGVPRLGVEFYAKGGIMKGATPFGMNGNNLMVGGEAGDEAVLPLNRENLGMIGEGIAATMGGNVDSNGIMEAIKTMTAQIVAAIMATKNTYLDGDNITAYVENAIMKGAGI